MTSHLILASGSEIRAQLLQNAGLKVDIQPAHIDEDQIRVSLQSSGADTGHIAAYLAQAKAEKTAKTNPGQLVLGCDQIAAFGTDILAKPLDQTDAIEQLKRLSGKTHHLFSAAVLLENNVPVWQQIGVVSMQMRPLSLTYINGYVARNWHSIRHSVGCYKLEEEGVRLFSAVQGDYFHVLGLPLVELLSYLTGRGVLEI